MSRGDTQGLSPRSLGQRVSIRVLFAVLMLSAAGGPLALWQPSTARAQSPAVSQAPELHYRRIFVLDNQAASLLPSDYRPVVAEELERLLEQRRERAEQLNESKPHLHRVLYRVGYDPQSLALRSDQTTLDIAYSGDHPSYLDLGTVNWALTDGQPLPVDGDLPTRWLTDPDGHSLIALTGSAQLDVAWSLAGTRLPDESVKFLLQIPRCSRSQMFLHLPETCRLHVDRGVARELASPPAEVGGLSGDTPRRWYRLELGGLAEVELTITEESSTETRPPLVVRRQSMRYQVSAESTRWTADLTIEAMPGERLPPVLLNRGRTTAVRLGEQSLPYTEVVDEQQVRVQWTDPVPGPRSNVAVPIELTIEGVAENLPGAAFRLPWPEFLQRRILVTTPVVQVQIRSEPEIRITELHTPPTWHLHPTVMSENGSRTVLLDGAMGASFQPPAIQIQHGQDACSADAVLRLSVEDRTIHATWKAAIVVAQNRDPIQLEFEPDWRVESLQIADSGRVIDVAGNQDVVTIWPEAADISDDVLRLQVTGQRVMRSVDGNNSRTIHATWFARIRDCRTRSVAAVVPPQSFRWAAGTVLRGPLVQATELPPNLQELLGPLDDGSLLFRLSNGTTPRLELERPLPEIDADLRLSVSSDGDEITEVLTFSCKSPSAVSTQLLIRCGDRHGRPPLTWSLAEGTGSGWSLPQPQPDSEDQQEAYLVALPAEQRGTLQLTARRHYPVDQVQTIDLPSINQVSADENAASISVNQSLIAEVDASLHVKRSDGPVQRVPSREDAPQTQRLRYQPNDPARVLVTPATAELVPAILWEENVDVIASVRWGDAVIARYHTDGMQPLRIRYGARLRLLEVVVNDEPQNIEALESSAGSLTIPASGLPSHVELRFDSAATSSGLVRRYEPPELEASGVVLKKNWRMWPAVDTFAPNIRPWRMPALAAQATTPLGSFLQPQAGQSVDGTQQKWLLSSELAWAAAAVIALFVLAVCWALSRCSVTTTFLVVALSLTVAVGWPDWFLVIIGFVTTPALVAALLAVSLRDPSDRFLEPSGSSGELDFSYPRTSASLLLAWMLCSAGGVIGHGQEAEEPSPGAPPPGQTTSAAPVYSILIPVDEQGEVAGTHVYIPDQLYSRLFRRASAPAAMPAVRYHRADYRVRASSLSSRGSAAKLEVRLELETDSVGRPIRLPFAPEMVREIDILSDGLARSIRWSAQENAVALQLPKPGRTMLRMVLDAPIAVDDYGVYEIELSIPSIHSSGLAFDADAMVDFLAAPAALGASSVDPMMGDLSAELGPTDVLSLRWRPSGNDSDTVSPPLVRRFLVQASADRVVCECLMDVKAILGDTSDEILLEFGSRKVPTLLSSSWTVVPSTEEDGDQAGRLRLRSSNPERPPIRLAWEEQTADLPVYDEDASLRQYALPPVEVVGSTPLGPTFIAINHAPNQTLRIADTGLVVPMPIERFLAGWNSSVDVIEQAVVAEDRLPNLLLSTAAPASWQCEQSQQLLIRADDANNPLQLQLEYQAVIRPGDGAPPPMQLVVPRAMRIQSVRVAGVEVDTVVRHDRQQTLVSLPEWTLPERHLVRLTAAMDVPANGRFAPPFVQLEGAASLGGNYSMARSTDVAVAQLKEPALTAVPQSVPDSERLTRSIIPLWAWQVPAGDLAAVRNGRLNGRFEVTSNPTETATVQMTELSFEGGRWTMETVIKLRPLRGRVDFLTVEIPSRWSEDVSVSSADSWSSQPAADPAKRLLRILPSDSAKARHEIRVRGRLVGGDLSQVSVPHVRVLGEGPRRVVVSVPEQIDQTPIDWEITGPRRSPEEAEETAFLEPRPGYRRVEVAGGWSATMVATAQTPPPPEASVLDVQFFVQQDRPALVICRWDLYPADLDEVSIRLPSGFQIVGQWSGGAAVPVAVEDTPQGTVATLPLSLSQLAQSIVLLGHVQMQDGRRVALPELLDIPVGDTWITRFNSRAGSTETRLRSPWRPATLNQRYEALSKSVLVSLERSRDALANRPAEEVTAWITPWVARFQKLNPSTVVDSPADPAATASAEPDATEQAPDQRQVPEPQAQDPLEQRLADYLDSVLGNSEWNTPPGDASPLIPAGWTVAAVYRHAGDAATLRATFLGTDPLRLQAWQQPVALATLALLVLLAVARFWKRLQRWTDAPAFWLFLIGLVGFVLAPLPVAIALCFVAITARTLRRPTPQHP